MEEDEIERLRAILGDQDVCEEPTEEEPTAYVPLTFLPQPEPPSNANVYSDSDDDEKVLSFHHRIGGDLAQVIGPAQGKAIC